MKKLFFVFDVESIGLHGEGFAAGFVVVDGSGKELASGLAACPPEMCPGEEASREWVRQNVPVILASELHPVNVRHYLWAKWMEWKARGAIMAADCLWPVEARFLCACVQDNPVRRTWEGPYPFIDIGSVLLAKGIDPLGKFPRRLDEWPEHNPLCDARQSARLLVEALNS